MYLVKSLYDFFQKLHAKKVISTKWCFFATQALLKVPKEQVSQMEMALLLLDLEETRKGLARLTPEQAMKNFRELVNQLLDQVEASAFPKAALSVYLTSLRHLIREAQKHQSEAGPERMRLQELVQQSLETYLSSLEPGKSSTSPMELTCPPSPPC